MKYKIERIGSGESKWQRWLWCLYMLLIVLTVLTYSDKIDLILRVLVVGLVPLILQVHHTYSQVFSCSFTKKLAILGSLVATLIGLILISTVFLWNISGEKRHKPTKVAATEIIFDTWNFMYTVESMWQVTAQLAAIFSNIFFICSQI